MTRFMVLYSSHGRLKGSKKICSSTRNSSPSFGVKIKRKRNYHLTYYSILFLGKAFIPFEGLHFQTSLSGPNCRQVHLNSLVEYDFLAFPFGGICDRSLEDIHSLPGPKRKLHLPTMRFISYVNPASL